MGVKNSYIFLHNKKEKTQLNKENKENALIFDSFDTCKSVHSYIAETFNLRSEINSNSPFKHIFESAIKIDNSSFNITFIINEVGANAYLDVFVEGQTSPDCIKCLEEIHYKIEKSDIQSEFIMIISFDAISEHYCNEIYPKLNKLERNLRELLFNIYVVNFGKNYYSNVDDDLQIKIKERIKAKGNSEKKEAEYLKNFFYSFEFNEIKTLLFTPRTTKNDIEISEKFLLDNPDLSKLSHKELQEAFYRLMPKSDWERFFDNKFIDENFEISIDNIRKYRNSIAHCKFFYSKQYKDCNEIIKQFNSAIISAISITKTKDFYEKNSAILTKSLSNIFEQLKNLSEQIKQSMPPIEEPYNLLSDSLYNMSKELKHRLKL